MLYILQVLQRIPHSYLWLLNPKKIYSNPDSNSTSTSYINKKYHNSIQSNSYKDSKSALYDILSIWGILKSRLIFADYVSKEDHLLRHQAADLFLDTLVYGAHSTATDALRGVIG